MASQGSSNWQQLVEDKRRRQQASIPPEWVLKSPPAKDVLDVRAFPDSKECGLLTEREVMITNTTDVDTLLGNLALGQWSSVEVTTAFYKRAVIAQQLVRSSFVPNRPLNNLTSNAPDKLPDRDICGEGPRKGQRG